MPALPNFYRHTLQWTLTGGEVASTSCAWIPDTPTGVIGVGVAENLAAKGLALWTALLSGYTTSTQYIGSKVQLFTPAGALLETDESFIAPVPGTVTGPGLPYGVAICMTMRTAVYGRSGRGRMYLPAPAASNLNVSGRLAGTNNDYYAEQVATYAGTPVTPDIVGGVVSLTTLTWNQLTAVECGDVLDSQRRRRDNLVEARAIQTV